MEQRGALQEQLDRIGPGIPRGDGEGHRVDVVGHDPGRTRREGGDAGHSAPTAQVSTVCPRTQAGSACTTRASSWPAGQTVAQKGTACGAPPPPRPATGPSRPGRDGPRGRDARDRGQRGQPREQRGRGDRHRPEHSGCDGQTCLRMRASHRQIPLP